jgi:hypothetical protein
LIEVHESWTGLRRPTSHITFVFATGRCDGGLVVNHSIGPTEDKKRRTDQ